MKKLFAVILVCILNFANVVQAADLPTITNSGFGSLNASSVYSVGVIEKLFAGFEVRLETYSAEGDEYSKIVVTNGDELIAEFSGDGDGGYWDAFAYSALILDANGVAVGMMAEKLPKSVLTNCITGAEAHADKLLCSFKSTSNIQYWIDGNEETADGAKLTAESKIYAIRWLPE